jgi:hypothetical protein
MPRSNCRWHGCDKPAEHCDVDHTVPYPLGPTHASDLKAYCRIHHLFKTLLGGAVTVLAPADPQQHAADAPLRADELTALPIPAARSWVAQMAASADDTAAPVGGK